MSTAEAQAAPIAPPPARTVSKAPPFVSGKALWWCLGSFGVGLGLIAGIKKVAIDGWAWSTDNGGLLMGVVGGAVLIAGGFLAGKAARKLCMLEMLVTALCALGVAEIPFLAMTFGHQPWVLSVEPKIYQLNVVVVVFGVGLATFLGSSLGFMLAGGGQLDFGYRYELFVAMTFLKLRGGRHQGKISPSAFVTGIAILGVVIGMMALTVVLSVMSGFEGDLKRKILGSNAHAIVLKYGTDFRDWKEVQDKVAKVKGVVGETPFTLNEVMLSSEDNLAGVVLNGIDPQTIGRVTDLGRQLVQGDLAWLTDPSKIPLEPEDEADLSGRLQKLLHDEQDEPASEREDALDLEAEKLGKSKTALPKPTPEARKPTPAPPSPPAVKKAPPAPVLPGIILGRELARSLRVAVGDKVNVVSPLSNELGPSGPIPKSRPYRVAAIFYSGMYEFDSKFAYLALSEAQKFFGLEGSVSGIELKVDDLDATPRIKRDILFDLDGYPYHVKDWSEMNHNLFAALAMEKLVMAIILGFASLPVGFLILAILMFLAFEKSKEIAVLKSMGARDQSIMKVFVFEGLIIGGIGAVLGLVVGLGVCGFIAMGGIPLDPSVYYIEALPVKVEPWQFAVVGIAGVLLSYLATIYPAVAASRLPPVEGLRNE